MTRKTQSMALLSMAAAGLLWAGLASAKTITVTDHNTPYSNNDIQKLAATAVGMGVKEPVKLNLQGGNLAVSGSTATTCMIKVGTGNTPQIGGISCK